MTLALLALLPFAGLGWFSVQALEGAASRVDAAAEIESRSPEVTRLAGLSSEMSTETYWASATAAIRGLGIPPEFIVDIIGIDILSETADARSRVDRRVADLDMDGLVSRLAIARASADAPESTPYHVDLAYVDVKEEVAGLIDTQLRELQALASEVPDSSDLTAHTDTLGASVDLREMSATVAFGYFAARYPGSAAYENPATDLIRATALYESTAESIDRSVIAGSVVDEAWQALKGDPLVADLLERAKGSTAEQIGADESFLAALNLSDLDVEAEAAAFVESLVAVDRHLEFVDLASEELALIAAAVGAETKSSQRSVVALTLGIGAASLLAAALVAWWIVRPLRRMADVVEAMRQGELGGHVKLAGPHEVRATARALNEAADHLKVAEQQAVALADEDLENPLLREHPPGALGASLQHAVQRLAASLVEREEFRRRLEHEATHDGLTGLMNRSAAMEGLTRSLARIRRSDQDLAVLFIDVDEFKQINDRFGHNVGDVVLRAIADRIVEAIREGDLACRLGGDEFLVVADPISEPHEALIVANRVLDTVSRPILVDGTEITPAISIGVAVAGDADLTADEILRDADLAVYRAKDLGRSRVEVCDVKLRGELAARVDVEDALREAIDRHELVMHYQPVVDADGEGLVSLEALVRWDRPGYGLVPPAGFIPVAERSNLIVAIDEWVLSTVIDQLAGWSDHPVLGAVPVAVNISARHLATQSLVDSVLDRLGAADVVAGRLTLEITESALLDDLEGASDQLDQLRSHGVQVALDDFGTGYTSLAHLRQLPVDVLKIDRTFINNLASSDDRTLVQLIVHTGHLLGASITAEGVETLDQAEDLLAMGSDHLQGFRYSTALSPRDLEEHLVTRPGDRPGSGR